MYSLTKQKLISVGGILFAFLMGGLSAFPNAANAEPRKLYNIASFGCDYGHENFGILLPDGRPACGTGNCPGPPARPPGGCWAQHVVMPAPASGNEAGVWWDYDDKGRLSLGVSQDHHIIAWTWLWVKEDKTIHIDYGIDSGGAFVTNITTEAFHIISGGNVPLTEGWNLLEFTGYHQHDSTSGGMPDGTDIVGQVDFMSHEPVNFQLELSRFPLQFVVDEDDPTDPPLQQVTIQEANGVGFEWTAQSLAPNWLSIEPTSGTTPTAVNISIDKDNLPFIPGTNEGTIFVTTNLLVVNEVGIKVIVEVTERIPEPDIGLESPLAGFCPQVPLGEVGMWPIDPSAEWFDGFDETPDESFRIFNKGDGDLTIFEIRSSDDLVFRPIFDNPITIAPSAGVRVDVLLTPQQVGQTIGTLHIESNDPDTPTVEVSICVEGTHFFENVANELGVEATAPSNRAVWGDYDKDGVLDLYVVNTGANVLYHNNGDGTFTPASAGVDDGRDGTDAVFGDYNNDGYIDLYVVNNLRSNVLYRNNGGTFEDVTIQAGVGEPSDGQACAFMDYDCDGWLDLIVVNENAPNFLYHNAGSGVFTEISMGDAGGNKKDVAVGDYDIDGFPDLYIVKDGATNVLYKNSGDGTPNPSQQPD